MMCEGCKYLADFDKRTGTDSTPHIYDGPDKDEVWRCFQPSTCTCQHHPVGSLTRVESKAG